MVAVPIAQCRVITSLPSSYTDLVIREPLPDNEADTSISNAAITARYEALHKRLTALDSARREQQDRLARYRQLATLLEPFENAQDTIQPNLVTRDGELGKELHRMRVLLARVTGGVFTTVAEMGEGEKIPMAGEMGRSNEEKLRDVMDLT